MVSSAVQFGSEESNSPKSDLKSGAVKFGLAFQASQPFSYYGKCAKLARKFGFDMLQVYDDLMFKPAWPILFSIAATMSPKDSFVIGPGVINPYHSHPSLIATNLACLDEETKGRAFVMIGKGAFHDLIDLEVKNPLAGIEDSVEIIHNILSRKQNDYSGTVFSARATAQLRWNVEEVSSGGHASPPIWIGTWGKKTCELAGRLRQVSGVMVSSVTDPGYIRFLRGRVEAGARSVKRRPDEVELGVVPGTIVSEDRDRAQKLAREASAIYLPYLSPMTEFIGISCEEVNSVKEATLKGDLALASSLVSDKAVDTFKLWGTPDDVIEKISRLVSKDGVDRINFGFGRGEEDIEGINLLGRKVLPYFKEKISRSSL